MKRLIDKALYAFVFVMMWTFVLALVAIAVGLTIKGALAIWGSIF